MLKPRFHVAYRLPWLLCAWEVLGTLPVIYTFIFLLFISLCCIIYLSYLVLYYFYLLLFIILLGTQNDWAIVRVCQR